MTVDAPRSSGVTRRTGIFVSVLALMVLICFIDSRRVDGQRSLCADSAAGKILLERQQFLHQIRFRFAYRLADTGVDLDVRLHQLWLDVRRDIFWNEIQQAEESVPGSKRSSLRS